MASAEQDLLEDKIHGICRRDRRYSRNAYFFALDALDYTMSNLGKDQLTGEDRHVGIGECCLGGDALHAEILRQAGPALLAHLDMTHGKRRVLEVAREAVAHFATGTEESD